ncbi:replication protein A 70 kDa DNA-binding subunit A-like isoform X2 [Lotus japonicus]|uniref:replication protein A 70 kDa DNA-binding subunit A-like isoform X2 n=1 Tax=Lotus japonicus TaxID=34305 RepID=UPI00258365D2|nr:replication protein A 70 kDa DNA-binding subunit A-like isoform X2 [Lotus japonicus]
MNGVFHDVSELRSGKEQWRIMVKVIRIWYSKGFASSKLPLSLECVLIDDKGNKIHANIKKTLMYKFEKLLVEGNVYSLSGFVLVDNTGDYKTTRHNYKICFMFKTEVRPMNQFTMDVFPYTFVSFPQILSPDYDGNYLVDVIGILTGVGVEREIVTNGKKSKMNVVEIDSEGMRIECALFGVYVDELTNFLGGGELNYPVVIIQFAKVKSFQGNNSFQNVHGATKILFDPVFPASEELKRRKTIAALKDLKKDCVCILYATICPVEEDVEWWYTACRCNRKVYADEKMYFCEGCNRHVLAVYPRYRLQLRVEDDSGCCNLVLFDKEASYLVGKSCTEVVESFEKGEGPNEVPDEFARFIGTDALFKIEVKNYHGQRFERSRFESSYRVKRVCTDEAIIQKFQSLQLEQTVGASSSRMPVTPQSIMKHEDVAKDLMDEFVVASGDKSPETPLCVTSPTIDLAGDTQDIINSKRSSSADEEEVPNVIASKKKGQPKMKKDKK